MAPEDLRYTSEHEWVRAVDDPGGHTVRVGITDFAQQALGDIVFVTLPEDGTRVTGGQEIGEIESTKSVSELYAPVAGTVVRRNDDLDANPELVNTDCYGRGWMLDIRLDGDADAAAALEQLLDADGYAALTKQ